LFAAAQGVRRVLDVLRRDGSLAGAGDHIMPLGDYYELVGLNAQTSREEAYDRAAADMARKHDASRKS
jgi:hypothetical protein